jgi:hypothetical protein
MSNHPFISLPLITNAPEDVYLVLWARSGADGFVQISQNQLARESGHPVEVVRAVLTLLVHAGYAHRAPNDDPRRDRCNGATGYRIAPTEPVRHLRVVSSNGDAS